MPFEGLILIDKPAGLTSHDIVAQVRIALQEKRVGHAGTLDPLATGLMIVLVGRATRLSDYLLTGDKTYEVEAQLGVETDTLDADGKTLSVYPGPLPSKLEIEKAILSCVGALDLQVPAYSAAKVNGKKLYELAREGKDVPYISKTMVFETVTIKNIQDDVATVEICCSKGSFIRAWVHEVGRKLGCGAHVKGLRRLASVPFYIEEAIALQDLKEALFQTQQSAAFVPLSNCLRHLSSIPLDGFQEKLMLSGQIPTDLIGQLPKLDQSVCVHSQKGNLVAVLNRAPNSLWKIGCVLG